MGISASRQASVTNSQRVLKWQPLGHANGGGTVHLSAARDGAHWRIEVADDGLGFESAEAARLFDKFYRPGDEMRRRTAGTGLGLYIVKKFVEEHGGRVRAASDGPGRGATFRVWWPATEEQAA